MTTPMTVSKRNPMQASSRILVTGANGLVGRGLVRHLQGRYPGLTAISRAECDLENRAKTIELFAQLKPEFVFHLAAKVGGIQANSSDPVHFLQSNLLSQTHVIEASYRAGVKRFLFLGSSCIYPRECRQPMKEDYVLTGPLEPTNEGYALAKIAGLKLAQYYEKQFGMQVVCPMPSNVYGPGDSFDFNHSHVLSALVRRFVDALRLGSSSVSLWGTGSARREFIYLDDLCAAIEFLMNHAPNSDIVNVGPGEDISIKELAETIAKEVGYSGALQWDTSKPDGMPRKCLEISRLNQLGYKTTTSLLTGIRKTIADYHQRYPNGWPGR